MVSISNHNGPLFSASDLHKHYQMGSQDLHVLRGVDLVIERGQWVAILGASGSGKSTLLHLLGGLDRPDGGSVCFEGQDIFRLRGKRLDRYRNRHVGFVFQSYHLLPELTAIENVLVAAMIDRSAWRWVFEKRDLRSRARELLGRIGLSDRMGHKPAELSGGERQRVAIARALINEPDVLLADEPTGNLDAQTGVAIIEVLEGFNKAGQTIVMVTHDRTVAAAAGDQWELESGGLRGAKPPLRNT